MPAPMMQPMPRNTRFHGPSDRLSSLASVSRWIWATLLRIMMRPNRPVGAALAIRTPLEVSYLLGADPNGSGAPRNPSVTNRQFLWLSRQHRPKRRAAEQVHVEMRHLLSAPLAAVRQQAIALRICAGRPRDFAHR